MHGMTRAPADGVAAEFSTPGTVTIAGSGTTGTGIAGPTSGIGALTLASSIDTRGCATLTIITIILPATLTVIRRLRGT